jgi:hypothetical protein
MYYSYVEIEYVATSFSPTRTDLALKLLMNLFKSFDSDLGKYTRKAARPSGGMESSNPRRWRGERLHHHGGGVCWLFVLLWMDS